jgi:hypothetical protein
LNSELNIRIKIAYAGFEKQYRKKIKRKQFRCLYRKCDLRSISSHSQQENGQLKHIHENKKVYALHDNACNVFDENSGEMQYEFILKPISKASVFPGLCNNHDTALFRCIEDGSLMAISGEQATAFLYRSISYEVFRKKREIDRISYMLEHMELYMSYAARNKLKEKLIIDQQYFDNNSLKQLLKVNDIMERKNYDEVCFMHKIIKRNVGASCTSMVNMYLDRYLEVWAEGTSDDIPAFSFSLVPEQNCTHVIFSWLKVYDEHSNIIRSYIENNFRLFLNRLIFCETEDVCIKPSFWESLSFELKEKIIFCMHHPLTRGQLNDEMVPIVIEP